jgi:pimeloyl-ACP methyl ester carboxylesterase
MGRFGRGRSPDPAPPRPSLPPPLPPGRLVDVPGRGEMLVREVAAGPGGGPTILLLHGWLLSADLNWFALYARLARHGRILALDVRGHGRGIRSIDRFSLEAAADDAAALLDHLHAGPAVVLGYSMGGSIAQLLCRRHPEAVAGLVLQSTALQWREERHEQVLWRLMGGLDWTLRAGVPRALTERYLARAVGRNPARAPFRDWIEAEAFRGDPRDLADAGRALAAFDARPYAGEIRVPTVVVVTTRDGLVAPRRQYALVGAIPGAGAVPVDVGHNAWLMQPDLLGDALEAALATVVGRLAAPAEFGHTGGRGGSATASGSLEVDLCPTSSPC